MARRLIPISGTQTTTTGNHYPLNRIITRGMGPSTGTAGRAGMVTQGYGGTIPQFVIDGIQFRQINLGQSGTKRRIDQLDEVIIWAKLVEVNGQPSPAPIKGWVKVKVDKSRGTAMVEHIAHRSRAAWEFIKVTARRLR